MKTNSSQETTLECHHHWLLNSDKFNERLEKNLNTCLEHIEEKPDPASYNFLGYIYVKKNKMSEAEDCFKKALVLGDHQQDPVALANLIWFYQTQGRTQEAQKHQERFFSIPENIRKGYQCWSKAYAHVRLFEYTEAISLYDQAIQYLPNEYKFYLYKGILLNRKKRNKEAFEVLLNAEKLNQNDHLIFLHLARAREYLSGSKNKKFIEVKGYLDQAFSLKPNDEDTLKSYGILLTKKKKYQDAIDLFTSSIKGKPTTCAYHQRGKVYKEIKNFLLAQQDFEQAVALDPKNFTAVFDLIDLYIEIKEFNKALIQIQTLPERIHDNNPRALKAWGEVLIHLEEFNDAEKKFQKILKIPFASSKNKEEKKFAKNWLGNFYKENFEATQDVSFCIRLIELYMSQADQSAARDLVEKQIKKIPTNFELNYYKSFFLFFDKGQENVAMDYLIQAFICARSPEEKFKCYDLYKKYESVIKDQDRKNAFLEEYSKFESEFHKDDAPIWHRTLDVVYGSKSKHKCITLFGEPTHLQLRKNLEKEPKKENSSKSSKKLNEVAAKINEVAAKISFVVSSIDPDSNERIRKSISFSVTSSEDKGSIHVSDNYLFEKNGKEEYGRSKSLLTAVLASKPMKEHENIHRLFDNEKNAEFHRRFHCSERALYGSLNKQEVIDDIVTKLEEENRGQKDLKIYMMVLDLHSTRYLCHDCQESMFFWYNPRSEFIKKLVDALRVRNHNVQTKSGTIDSLVRVSAEKPGFKQSVKTVEEHQAAAIDFKKQVKPYNVMLLQRDDQVTADPKSASFINIKSRR